MAWGRGKKNFQNSEYSGFRLFGRIEWVPPLTINKHLRVMRRTGKQAWGIFYWIVVAKNMPLRPRHTPTLISGAELCPQPEINPVLMGLYSLLTHILEWWMWIQQKIIISGRTILKMKKHSRSLGNFVNQFHTWVESFNNYQCLECWAETMVIFLSWVEPWTMATS